jgi:acyl-CoA reductase-like NAD-dependent aldehyde dehydrogenase
MKVRDADEGVRLANASRYGLTASVWTKNLHAGQVVARRLEAGSVCVNDCLVGSSSRFPARDLGEGPKSQGVSDGAIAHNVAM